MADNKIRFSLFSEFDGEGFKKASTAVTNMGKEAKKAQGILGNLAGQLGGLDNPAGKAANAIQTFVSGFAGMGLIGGVIAGVKVAFDAYCEWQKKKLEELVNAAISKIENFRRKTSSLFGQLDSQKSNDSIQKQFDQVNNAVRKSQQANQTAKLTLEQLQRNVDLVTDGFKQIEKEAKKVVDAENKVELANLAHEQALKNNEKAIKDATGQVERAKARKETADNAVIAAQAEVAQAQKTYEKSVGMDTETRNKYREEWKKSSANYIKAKNEQISATNDVTLAEQNLKQTQIDANTNLINTEIKKKQAENDLVAAIEEKNKAYSEATKAQEEADKKLKEATEEAARKMEEKAKKTYIEDIKAGMNDAIKREKDEGAERAKSIAERLVEANNRVDKAQAYMDFIKSSGDELMFGINSDKANHNGISGEGYKYDTLSDGSVYRQQDLDRAQRYRDKAQRDDTNKLKNQESAYKKADKKMADLEKELSKLGEETKGELEDTKKRREKLKKELDDEKKKVAQRPEEKKKAEKELEEAKRERDKAKEEEAQNVKDIKEKVELIEQHYKELMGVV